MQSSVVREQLDLYQSNHLLTHQVFPFDAANIASRVETDRDVIAIDLGGDKLRVAQYRVSGGSARRESEDTWQSQGGAGFLDVLERVRDRAADSNVRVGISAAIRLDGSIVQRTTNLACFHQEFHDRHGADFSTLFAGRSIVVNDTAAGIAGAAMRLAQEHQPPRNLAFFICGSGLGASVIDHGNVIHVEAAHVPLAPDLNPFRQNLHCHVDGKDYVCLERVTAMRAGVEPLYRTLTGESLTASALADLAANGDFLPRRLLESSALALVHAVAGVLERYRFVEGTTVVLHGGAFESPMYRALFNQALAAMPFATLPSIRFARDLSPNICLDGAAWLAAASLPQPT